MDARPTVRDWVLAVVALVAMTWTVYCGGLAILVLGDALNQSFDGAWMSAGVTALYAIGGAVVTTLSWRATVWSSRRRRPRR